MTAFAAFANGCRKWVGFPQCLHVEQQLIEKFSLAGHLRRIQYILYDIIHV
jgi:hypothetical protein